MPGSVSCALGPCTLSPALQGEVDPTATGRPSAERERELDAGARGSVVSMVTERIPTHATSCRLSHLPRLSHLLVCVATGANLVRSKFLHAALKSFYEIRHKAKTPGVEKVTRELPIPGPPARLLTPSCSQMLGWPLFPVPRCWP